MLSHNPAMNQLVCVAASGLNKYSGKITQPKSQGASQAMLYATGECEPDRFMQH